MLLREVLKHTTKSTSKAWGYQLSLDCRACDKSVVTHAKSIKKFILALVKEIDMKSHGPFVIDHFPRNDPKRDGYSCVQLIETSSIQGHFVDENGNAYIDVFSCKSFDIDKAVAFVQEHLKPEAMKVNFLTRDA